ncbi:MAG: AAA family ATPase [Bacillota bacterium]|nr:AAA family ATPase [Bacillota bacterium]
MSISNDQLREEQLYLDKVMEFLEKQLIKSKEIIEKSKKEVVDIHKTMMDDIGNDIQSLGKFVDAYSYLVEIDNRAGAMNTNEREHKRLLAMADSPYFARMDFSLEGVSSPLRIYIGIGSLVDEETMDFYVFDWRSPVASMYYDYELGKASYEAPQGKIEGDITLKRHFKVWKGEIQSVYDSSLAIEDQVLIEALSRSADSKMQTIVYTIQREQNIIIRDRESRHLIAFGPAGSGKTSVAMQRAAFFLYAYRNTITSDNLMIFSPNNVFGDYISEVLPKLGEENIKSSTFNAYAASLFGDKYKFLSSAEFLEFSINGHGIRKKAAELKTSDKFLEAILKRTEEINNAAPPFSDAVYAGKLIMSGKEMEKLYVEDLKFLKPQARLNKLYSRLASLTRDAKKARKKALLETIDRDQDPLIVKEETVKKSWEARCEYFDFLHKFELKLSIDAAKEFLDILKALDKDVYEYTKENLEAGYVSSEDAPALLYIHSATRDIKNDVRYLIIDEAQDYTKLHYYCIKNCFEKSNITFLGDTNQAVCPIFPLCTPEDILKVFPSSKVASLSKSYRSTKQISEFCGNILGLSNMDYMNREGERVSKVTLTNKEDYFKAMELASKRFSESGMTSAIIFPTLDECRELYDSYGKEANLKLITGLENTFTTGSVILPAYMAKGLEFDGVIIPYDSYKRDDLKYVYYTACSRALHSLKLFEY